MARGRPRAGPAVAAALLAALLGAVGLVASPRATAATLRLCGGAPALTAAEQSRVLRVTAVVRELMAEAGVPAVLVSRAGQKELARFGERYSHMGVALAANPHTPWSVRQLYFDCDAAQARLFDEGLAGYLMGLDDPRRGFVSLVFPPPQAAAALAARALDRDHALALLGEAYSANAYPFDTRFQNCNQWVVELLATAWAGPALPAPVPAVEAAEPRAGERAAAGPLTGAARRQQAQAWLREQRYAPTTLVLSTRWWLAAAAFVPWVHTLDHPAEDLDALRVRLSLPASVEGFVRQQHPMAERVELCHDDRQLVVRRGWQPMGEACEARPGDRVIPLD